MRCERAHKPRWRASLRYAPGTTTLGYLGEMSEDWIIYDVPETYAPLSVAACPDLPQPGDYSTEAGISGYVVSRLENLTDTAEKNTWRVTVIYTPDPGDLPTEVYYSTTRVMEAVYKDQNDAVICNTAGDPFNPPVTEARCLIRLRVVKRYDADTFENATMISTYAEHRSSADIIVPGLGTVVAGHLYCGGIDATLVQEPIWHYLVTFDFEIDVEREFAARLLNRGYAYLDDNGKRVAFKTDEGVAHGQPGLLDINGNKVDPEYAIYLTFVTKPSADFNALNLF